MPKQAQKVSKLNYDIFFKRLDAIFTQAYIFSGELDVELLKTSYLDIVTKISKFNYQLEKNEAGDFQWEKNDEDHTHFSVINSSHPEDTFKEVAGNCYHLLGCDNRRVPIGLVLIVDKYQPNFILTVLADHAYVDGQSANHIFNLILGHYNSCLTDSNSEEFNKAAEILYTASEEEITKLLTDQNGDLDSGSMAEKMAQYPFAVDAAGKISPGLLKEYKASKRTPVFARHNISKLIAYCRNESGGDKLTKNSIVCAVLAKSFLAIDPYTDGEEKNITMSVATSLLSEEHHHKYCGNYAIVIPVTLDIGTNNIVELAKLIQNRIKDYKSSQQDLNTFKLTEMMCASEPTYIDDGMTFHITNWTNHQLLFGDTQLGNCKFNHHIGILNYDPENEAAASLVNKQSIIISFSPENELSIGISPSFTQIRPLEKLLTLFPKVVEKELM